MDTTTAMAIGQRAASRGDKHRVFDWDKAARIILERKPETAVAGLSSDMEYTSGEIWTDGKPNTESYTYLASNWAEPVLEIEDEELACWIYEGDNGSAWNEHTKWPESALDILKGV